MVTAVAAIALKILIALVFFFPQNIRIGKFMWMHYSFTIIVRFAQIYNCLFFFLMKEK